jgi:hypothetical protein
LLLVLLPPVLQFNCIEHTVVTKILFHSDPDSPRYGEYLSAKETQELTAVPGLSKRIVSLLELESFCQSLGDSLLCAAPISKITACFHTSFHVFRHESGKQTIRQVGEMSVLSQAAESISFVTGLSTFFSLSRGRTVNEKGQGAGKPIITPNTLRELYNVSESELPANTPSTIVAVAEFDFQPVLPNDTSLFASSTNLDVSVVHTVNPYSEVAPAGGEGTLDAQYAGALAQGTSLWVWNQEHWIFEFSQAFQNMTAPRPSVVSMSYAWSEEKTCSGVTNAECKALGVDYQEYIKRSNIELQKLGVMGASIGKRPLPLCTSSACLLSALPLRTSSTRLLR